MGHVVADVAKDASTEGRRCSVPVVPDKSVCKLPEWGCKNNEERWRHDQSQSVHWEIMVNAVKQEM